MKEARPFISSLSSSCGGQRSRVLILKGRRQVHGEWSLHLGHQDAQPLVGGVGGASVLSVSSLLEASTETPSPLSLRVPWFSSAYSEMGWISSTAHVPLPVGDPDSEAWDLGCRVGSRAFQDLQSWESQMGGPCRIPGGCERQFSDAAYVLVLGLTLCYSGFQMSQKPRYP